MKQEPSEREFDFALIIGNVPELNQAAEDALFNAGCDDATFSIRYGLLYAEFSRSAKSLQNAIISAIQDVRRADIDADVLRVDECNLVTGAEIARRINRSRQLVSQYISGQRGPGAFPPPECQLCEGSPLWAWCVVSHWLAQNNLIAREASWSAQTVAAINTSLEATRQRIQYPNLVIEISEGLRAG